MEKEKIYNILVEIDKKISYIDDHMFEDALEEAKYHFKHMESVIKNLFNSFDSIKDELLVVRERQDEVNRELKQVKEAFNQMATEIFKNGK